MSPSAPARLQTSIEINSSDDAESEHIISTSISNNSSNHNNSGSQSRAVLPDKRPRGRPKKNPRPSSLQTSHAPQKKPGRPRKEVITQQKQASKTGPLYSFLQKKDDHHPPSPPPQSIE